MEAGRRDLLAGDSVGHRFAVATQSLKQLFVRLIALPLLSHLPSQAGTLPS
jgi:hypothetical protein